MFRSRKAHALTEKDTVVLADFTNTTGDPIFDGTLRQGLTVQLQQSPFLSLVPDQHIQQTLRLMGNQPTRSSRQRFRGKFASELGARPLLMVPSHSLALSTV